MAIIKRENLGRTDFSGVVGRGRLPDIHPGEILNEDFLGPLGVTQYRLAQAVAVPPRRINEIVHGKRAISADTALRLARYFGTTPDFWINLQAQYDLRQAEKSLKQIMDKIKPLVLAA
ncbi:MAG: HigA family addiction module antidote protein [Burkholderiales bacterium]|nr:HigA family addiction module antidote protein [Burkholderiales bacterium]